MKIDIPTSPDTPLGRCLTVWHEFLSGDRSALERVIADDAVLHSPVLFAPQHGKDLVVMYLTGASMTFVGDGSTADEPRSFKHPSGEKWDGRFRYIRSVLGDRDAILEFETVMAGKYVNGVDMITCNDDGLIVDFKVMVRPMQAVDAVRQQMMAALEQINAGR
ncbi:MAG: nuclear transport factor 2 family protein [Ilumatobacteraceae bacterium]|nr:MAG: nuclear transport factor 2 family protein [Actinomycetota bacterium]